MKKKLAVLGASLALLALLAGRVPTTHATDPFNDGMSVYYAACTSGGTCNADTTVDAGEPVSTQIVTSLNEAPVTSGGSFYDAVQTVVTGISPTAAGTVPAGTKIGEGFFHIQIAVGTPCSGASATLTSPIYDIFATNDANALGTYPSLGYAKGLAPAESWATFDSAGWIQDFDDDDNDNIPDSIETSNATRAHDTLAETVVDENPANGVKDGADKEPLFIPLLDTIVGTTHSNRGFGDAVVAAGVVEVGVDFVTYKDVPSVGSNTQFAVISEGGGLGLLPSDPSSSTTSTCPPFDSQITTFGTAGGQVVQTANRRHAWLELPALHQQRLGRRRDPAVRGQLRHGSERQPDRHRR